MSTSDPVDTDFDLLPPDPALVNPDLALDAALAPVDDMQPDAPIPFGKSWQFDFITGQFVRRGSLPAETYELDTLVVWVEKTLRTAAYTYPIYTDSYGIDTSEPIIGETWSDEMLGPLQDVVTEALLTHDRITDVTDFSAYQDPFDEILYASFTVVTDATTTGQAQTLDFNNVPILQ